MPKKFCVTYYRYNHEKVYGNPIVAIIVRAKNADKAFAKAEKLLSRKNITLYGMTTAEIEVI